MKNTQTIDKNKELVSLLKQVLKKRTIKQVGISLLVSQKMLKVWRDEKEMVPTHARATIKKALKGIIDNT